MYDIINYPQFDIDYNESDEVDYEKSREEIEIPPSPSIEEIINVKNVGSLSSSEPPKVSFNTLPSEVLLTLLRLLDDPFDIVNLSGVNRFLNSFIQRNSCSLSRQQISIVELRRMNDINDDDSTVIMNLTCTYYGSSKFFFFCGEN